MSRRQVSPGITIDRRSQVQVEGRLHETLCEMALDYQADDDYPVDVEHVLAALVMASRAGEIEPDVELAALHAQHRDVLGKYVRIVFQQFRGRVSGDD